MRATYKRQGVPFKYYAYLIPDEGQSIELQELFAMPAQAHQHGLGRARRLYATGTEVEIAVIDNDTKVAESNIKITVV